MEVNKMHKSILKTIYVGLIVALLASAATIAFAAPAYQDEATNTVVDVLTEDGRFSTLITALDAAGLVETLQGEGPFTVFAPTDDAFASLPAGALDDLLADPTMLNNVLLMHVVDGEVMAADVAAMDQAQTLSGAFLDITVDGDTVMVDDATVTEADMAADNGVIHVIDTVLMPSEEAMMAEGTMEPTAEGTMEGTVEGTMEATMAMTGTVEPEGTAEAMAEDAAMSAASGTCSEDYVVQADDTLGTIADKFFGNTGAYTAIVEATNAAAQSGNYQPVDDPNLIFVGQTLCIPENAEAEALMSGGAVTAPTAEGEAMATEEAMMEEMSMYDIPEGKALVNFENFASVDLILDLTGPTRLSTSVAPGATQELFVEPGDYTFNGHQPGGAYVVNSGEFSLAVGEGITLSCSDSPACFIIPIEEMMAPATMEAEMTVETTIEATIEATVELTGTVEPTVESTVEATVEATTEATVEPTIEATTEP
ncbi:MAG: fasciclin domain-containing protein [Anaerolineae bacterium]|nr:fasciclin domain-containing protein [Anaerolineae bacterium]